MHYFLKIKSHTKNLEKIRQFTYETALKNGLNSEDALKIEMAVDEACTNVIKHAYKDKKPEEIILHLDFYPDRVLIRVLDRGKGFNLNDIKPVDINEYINEEKIGGLGIHLMRQLMDVVEYKIDHENYNELLMIKYLS